MVHTPESKTSVWRRTAGAVADLAEKTADRVADAVLSDEQRLERAEARQAAARNCIADIDRRIDEGDEAAADEMAGAQDELAAGAYLVKKIGQKVRAKRAAVDNAAEIERCKKHAAAYAEAINTYWHWVTTFDRSAEGARNAIEQMRAARNALMKLTGNAELSARLAAAAQWELESLRAAGGRGNPMIVNPGDVVKLADKAPSPAEFLAPEFVAALKFNPDADPKE